MVGFWVCFEGRTSKTSCRIVCGNEKNQGPDLSNGKGGAAIEGKGQQEGQASTVDYGIRASEQSREAPGRPSGWEGKLGSPQEITVKSQGCLRSPVIPGSEVCCHSWVCVVGSLSLGLCPEVPPNLLHLPFSVSILLCGVRHSKHHRRLFPGLWGVSCPRVVKP